MKRMSNSAIVIFYTILGVLFMPNILLAYNFCDKQPAGGDKSWDIRDKGNVSIPFKLIAGDVWTNIEQVNSVKIVGRHQFAGDLAAELEAPLEQMLFCFV